MGQAPAAAAGMEAPCCKLDALQQEDVQDALQVVRASRLWSGVTYLLSPSRINQAIDDRGLGIGHADRSMQQTFIPVHETTMELLLLALV